MKIPTNTPLLCSYNDNEGNHHGYIVAVYKNDRFYSGLYPINRVTGWREIPKEGFNEYNQLLQKTG
ncbi:hypothetical protein [Pseudoalteromonas phage AL]|nr:hypothetical protein [Pseudoalteromonas phage AL]WMM36584.1 hypothetical protein [Pseudoalteromonas phage PS_L5]